MGGSQKSKGVTWASDEYLCQVRLFLLEESPSQVGSGAQDHLQAKASWASASTGMVSDENLPPGFEELQPANTLRNNFSQIPLIKWKCPPRYVLNYTWRVVAGEESKEAELQKQREMRVLEAIYPRPSAIPPDPVVVNAEEFSHYDQLCPLVPITPIEDEDAGDMMNDSAPVNTVPMSVQPQLNAPPTSSLHSNAATRSSDGGTSLGSEVISGIDPHVLAAAHSALSAFMTNNGQDNLIDRDLLIKILSDPKMIELLVRKHDAVASTQPVPQAVVQDQPPTNMQMIFPSATQGLPVLSTPNRLQATSSAVSLPASASLPMNRTDPHLAHASRPEGAFYPPQNRVSSAPNLRPMVPEMAPTRVLVPPPATLPSLVPPVSKDINYYKSLIQQHGGERQDTMSQFGIHGNHHLVSMRESSNIQKPRDLKQKIMKPCIYYNTSRGCRNGANCEYLHDASSQQRVNSNSDSANPKRMKMDREITGT